MEGNELGTYMDAGRYASFRKKLGSGHEAVRTLWYNFGAGIRTWSRLVETGDIGELTTFRDLYVIHL